MRENNYSKWGTLTRLTFVGTVYQLQHYTGSSMLDDLGISNFEYSILSGPCTLFITALSIMPLSRISDRIVRPVIFLLICSVFAAVFTLFNSLASGFWTLLWPRIGFSFVSSPISPTNLRILTDFFDTTSRGTSSSVYFLSVYIGLSLCSLSLILSFYVGWRMTFIIISISSLVISVLSLLTSVKYIAKTSISSVKKDIVSLYSNKTLVLSVTGLSFKYINQFVRASFEAIYFAQAFSSQILMYSILNSAFILVSPISAIVIGKVSDSLENRFPAIRAHLCAVTMVGPVPLFIIAYLTDSFVWAMICIGVSSLLSEAYIGVSYAIMINVTLPSVKAFQSAWMMSITMIVGGISVAIIGFFYEDLYTLQVFLICFSSIPLSLSGLCYYLIGRVYQKDLENFIKKTQENQNFINLSLEYSKT